MQSIHGNKVTVSVHLSNAPVKFSPLCIQWLPQVTSVYDWYNNIVNSVKADIKMFLKKCCELFIGWLVE